MISRYFLIIVNSKSDLTQILLEEYSLSVFGDDSQLQSNRRMDSTKKMYESMNYVIAEIKSLLMYSWLNNKSIQLLFVLEFKKVFP